MFYFCTPLCKKKVEESVAQLVEQYTFNVWALGSSPSRFTEILSKKAYRAVCLFAFCDVSA